MFVIPTEEESPQVAPLLIANLCRVSCEDSSSVGMTNLSVRLYYNSFSQTRSHIPSPLLHHERADIFAPFVNAIVFKTVVPFKASCAELPSVL
jgi:hypothetical protein